MERMYDLSFEKLVDGIIRIEQRDGCGESCIIDMHPMQLRHMAERVGLIEPLPVASLSKVPGAGADKMDSLEIEQNENGTIYLYQTRIEGMGGSDEHIVLHRVQAAWLGMRLLHLAQYPLPSGGE